MDEDPSKSQKNDDWKTFLLIRCSELEPKVLGLSEPSIDEALVYFKYHEILNSAFGIGLDFKHHPRNPYNKAKNPLDKTENLSQNIPTMTVKEQEIVKFLQKEMSERHSKVFGEGEPSMTDRMTFFAYNQYLFVKHGLGLDLSTHSRNPWKDAITPLNFSDFSQIRSLPEHLKEETAKSKTQVLPEVTILPPSPENLWRVFDKDKPLRTVYQGSEGDCYKWTTKANKDTGYMAFDYIQTGKKIEAKEKEKFGFKTPPQKPLVTYPSNITYYNFKNSKTKVQEYLKRCKEQPAAEPEQK
jgi:hypothetical protein